jgi:23S rRNA maturation-related 3'-5' exoribonuclease YhaM
LLQDAARQVETAETRLEPLRHIVLAHHGRPEWGAPCEPHTVEAWLVHLADVAEARLWGWSDEEGP